MTGNTIHIKTEHAHQPLCVILCTYISVCFFSETRSSGSVDERNLDYIWLHSCEQPTTSF